MWPKSPTYGGAASKQSVLLGSMYFDVSPQVLFPTRVPSRCIADRWCSVGTTAKLFDMVGKAQLVAVLRGVVEIQEHVAEAGFPHDDIRVEECLTYREGPALVGRDSCSLR